MTGGGPDETVVLTPEMVQGLAGLHDLQLVEISRLVPGRDSWPLFAIVASVVALLLAGWVYWRRRPRQQRLRRLARLRRECGDPAGATPGRIGRLAELLREAAVSAAMPPGLSGEAWLAWLDERTLAVDRGAFTAGIGRQLRVWPYIPESNPVPEAAQVAELFALVHRWLKVNG